MMLREQTLHSLFAQARQAAAHAYAPYSQFRVGAALLLDDGSIITGCNVENASYGLTICAERSAVVRAISERGGALGIVAVAVANENSSASAPCGACRQVLSEFVTPEAVVIFPIEGGEPGPVLAFSQLFPHTFRLEK